MTFFSPNTPVMASIIQMRSLANIIAALVRNAPVQSVAWSLCTGRSEAAGHICSPGAVSPAEPTGPLERAAAGTPRPPGGALFAPDQTAPSGDEERRASPPPRRHTPPTPSARTVNVARFGRCRFPGISRAAALRAAAWWLCLASESCARPRVMALLAA